MIYTSWFSSSYTFFDNPTQQFWLLWHIQIFNNIAKFMQKCKYHFITKKEKLSNLLDSHSMWKLENMKLADWNNYKTEKKKEKKVQ